jgi:general secretion pathway protein H
MNIATHNCRAAFSYRQCGFTLVELLVVLVVISIALGMVVVQLMPDNRAVLREESQRLALLLENAGMEARSSGHPLAWSAEKNGYRFSIKNEYGDWVGLNDDAMFRPRQLPEEVQIAQISVETQPLKPGEPLALSAYSFALPFNIRLISGSASASVIGSSTGAVTAQLDGETREVPSNVRP